MTLAQTHRAWVFAYGSNLLPARLQVRTPIARLCGLGSLAGHELAFGKRGQDGSGKAYLKARAGVVAPGALFVYEAASEALVNEAIAVLDRYEGVGNGYVRVRLPIQLTRDVRDVAQSMGGGTGVCEAFVYMAEPGAVVEGLAPFDWYRDLVLAGARYHAFDAAHVRAIEAVKVVSDSDPERVRQAKDVLAGPPDLSLSSAR